MGSIGPFQLLIIALVILILFGRGRISEMMGDFGKGVKSFRKGMNDEVEDKPAPQIEAPQAPAPAETDRAPEAKRASDISDSSS